MFKRKITRQAQRERELRAEIATITDRLNQLRHTRIRVSIPTTLGIKPIYDVPLEYAIMKTNMNNGTQPGYQVEGMGIEVISQYSPLTIPEDKECDVDQPHIMIECNGYHLDGDDV
jgi:hypothetical protein